MHVRLDIFRPSLSRFNIGCLDALNEIANITDDLKGKQDSDLDLDLELRETARVDLGQFNEDMSRLIDNCEAGAGDEAEDVNGDGANDPGDVCSSSNNVTSGTEAGDRSLARDSSVPDFSLIQRQTCVNRRLWKLTGFSEHESLNFSETSDHDNASLVSRDTEYKLG